MCTEIKSQVKRQKQNNFSQNFQQSKSALILNTLSNLSFINFFVF